MVRSTRFTSVLHVVLIEGIFKLPLRGNCLAFCLPSHAVENGVCLATAAGCRSTVDPVSSVSPIRTFGGETPPERAGEDACAKVSSARR